MVHMDIHVHDIHTMSCLPKHVQLSLVSNKHLLVPLYVCLYDRVVLPKGTNQNLSMRSL
jgi:hypothetical protein